MAAENKKCLFLIFKCELSSRVMFAAVGPSSPSRVTRAFKRLWISCIFSPFGNQRRQHLWGDLKWHDSNEERKLSNKVKKVLLALSVPFELWTIFDLNYDEVCHFGLRKSLLDDFYAFICIKCAWFLWANAFFFFFYFITDFSFWLDFRWLKNHLYNNDRFVCIVISLILLLLRQFPMLPPANFTLLRFSLAIHSKK